VQVNELIMFIEPTQFYSPTAIAFCFSVFCVAN